MSEPRFCSAVIARVYRLYFRSLDLWLSTADGELLRPEQCRFGPVIFAHSEKDALVLAGGVRHTQLAILVDRSRDGEWAGRLLGELGLTILRGSSLHDGSAAFRELLRVERKANYPIGICVDGPLGPQGRAKEGAVVLSKWTGRPVVPVGAAARHRLVIPRTWSGIFMPLLFSRTVVSLGEEIRVPAEATRKETAALTEELTQGLARARHIAEEAVRAG